MKPTLNIFTNFRMDNPERLLRMKDSFMSFKGINAIRWIINIRGAYKDEASDFLRSQLGEKGIISSLESGYGWFHDSRQLLNMINGDYVLYWIEDHINMASVSRYDYILQEMKASLSEYLFITFFHYYLQTGVFSVIPQEKLDNISTFKMDIGNTLLCLQKHPGHYLFAAMGIYQVDLFRKLLIADDPVPSRWPKETPFDLEKKATDIHWLPVTQSFPNYELFAPIDDDIGYNNVCLQARGLYAKRTERFTSVDEGIEKASAPEINVFHHYVDNANLSSARVIVPFIMQELAPKSVIDIGCGIGSWLKSYQEHGVSDITGLDGSHVPAAQSLIPAERFISCDLRDTASIKISRRFDLVSCLEVAEHLPESFADGFVEFLCGLGDTIVFSAAVPGQTGENHYNEQYMDYWVELFKKRDFVFLDAFRPQFWQDEKIEWWYRQNMFLVVKSSLVQKFRFSLFNGDIYIHPRLFERYVRR